MNQEEKQDKKFFQIIDTLNKQHKQGATLVFDCGELGFIRIWWGRYGWLHEWFEPSQEFKEVKDA